MSNATTGPWEYIDNPYGHDVIRGSNGRLIAHVFGDDAQAQEDASLIAAVPELLEALKDLLLYGTDTNYINASNAVDKARAAIAKAEGA